MPISGDAIRMMNFVDDISATLRRIQASLNTITADERKQLAEYMKKMDPAYDSVLHKLEKGA
jgi:hypothetical protein